MPLLIAARLSSCPEAIQGWRCHLDEEYGLSVAQSQGTPQPWQELRLIYPRQPPASQYIWCKGPSAQPGLPNSGLLRRPRCQRPRRHRSLARRQRQDLQAGADYLRSAIQFIS